MGVTALLLLYPQLPMACIVGSDIAHAVPLTLVAGIGHWATGAIDWHLMGVLLVGSLPGIVIGSYCAHRVPETALRLVLLQLLSWLPATSHPMSCILRPRLSQLSPRAPPTDKHVRRRHPPAPAFRLLRAVTNPSPPRRPWPCARVGRATSCRARTSASRNCR